MWPARVSASCQAPQMNGEARRVSQARPRKYSPGTAATPLSCAGRPCASKAPGTCSQPKSSAKPVAQTIEVMPSAARSSDEDRIGDAIGQRAQAAGLGLGRQRDVVGRAHRHRPRPAPTGSWRRPARCCRPGRRRSAGGRRHRPRCGRPASCRARPGCGSRWCGRHGRPRRRWSHAPCPAPRWGRPTCPARPATRRNRGRDSGSAAGRAGRPRETPCGPRAAVRRRSARRTTPRPTTSTAPGGNWPGLR